MPLPVRCMSCGRVLGNQYKYYLRRKAEILGSDKASPQLEIGSVAQDGLLGKIFDELGLVLPCCRNTLLTHVDIDGFM